MNNQKFQVFNVHTLGYSHVLKNLPLQDYSYSEDCTDYVIAMISDGHGSTQYLRSDRGAQKATEAATTVLRDFLENCNDFNKASKESNVEKLKQRIQLEWCRLVKEDYENDPLSEEELQKLKYEIACEDIDAKTKQKLQQYFIAYEKGENLHKAYGCTLIAVASCRGYTIGIHVGDGTCVAFYDDGECDQPIPADSKNMANITGGSMCNSDIRCRVHFFGRTPIAVFVASDGMDDSYGNGEGLYNFYRNVCLQLADKGNDFISTLEEKLSVISQKGSKDDMSIAGFYDQSSLSSSKELFQMMHERGKLRIEYYNMRDTSGGVTEYAMNAMKSKLDRARIERDKQQEESTKITRLIDTIKDKILNSKKKFNFDDAKAVLNKTEELKGKVSILEEQDKAYRQEVKMRKELLESAERNLQKNTDELNNASAELKRFCDDTDEYRRKQNEKVQAEAEREDIQKKKLTAEQEAEALEQKFDEMQKKQNDANQKMQDLEKQIQNKESEIKSLLEDRRRVQVSRELQLENVEKSVSITCENNTDKYGVKSVSESSIRNMENLVAESAMEQRNNDTDFYRQKPKSDGERAAFNALNAFHNSYESRDTKFMDMSRIDTRDKSQKT